MSISTYAELKTAVASWLNRASITTDVADFIRLAEAQMNREVKHWRGEKRSEGEIDTRYSTLPADWRSPIRLSVSTTNGRVRSNPFRSPTCWISAHGTTTRLASRNTTQFRLDRWNCIPRRPSL